MRSEAGIFLETAHQACPTRQRKQFGPKYFVPLMFSEKLRIEVIEHGIGRGE